MQLSIVRMVSSGWLYESTRIDQDLLAPAIVKELILVCVAFAQRVSTDLTGVLMNGHS